MKGKRWTKEEDDKLRELCEQRLTATKIAEAMGRSRNSIVGRIDRLCLKLKGSYAPRVAKPPKAAKPPKFRPAPQRPLPVRAAVEIPRRPQTTSRMLTLMELGRGHCRWPIGSMYCGADTVGKRSYCPEHCRISYVQCRGTQRYPASREGGPASGTDKAIGSSSAISGAWRSGVVV